MKIYIIRAKVDCAIVHHPSIPLSPSSFRGRRDTKDTKLATNLGALYIILVATLCDEHTEFLGILSFFEIEEKRASNEENNNPHMEGEGDTIFPFEMI